MAASIGESKGCTGGDLGVLRLCALPTALPFVANLLGGFALGLPFKIGGLGARFGLPWLIDLVEVDRDDAGVCGTTGVSNELRFTLLCVFLCRELWLAATPECKKLLLELLCCRDRWLSSAVTFSAEGVGGGGPLSLLSLASFFLTSF